MNFQSIMLLLASVALIGGLTYVGYMFNKLVRARQWPPAISRCPDYFELTEETIDGKAVCEDTRGVAGAGPFCPPGYTREGNTCSKTLEGGETVTASPDHSTKKVFALSPSLVTSLPDAERDRIQNDMRRQGLTWDGITT